MWRQPTKIEKISAKHISDEDLIPRLHTELNNTKINPVKKWAKDLSRDFFKDIQMAKKCMERCSALLIIGKMQIKTTMRYYLTHYWRKKQKITNVDKDAGKLELLHTVGGLWNGAAAS